MSSHRLLAPVLRYALVPIALLLCCATPALAQRAPAQLEMIPARASHIADSVLKLMTLEEKLGQITQSPAGFGQTGPTVDAAGEQQVHAS